MSARGGRPARRRRFSTANRSNRQKRGAVKTIRWVYDAGNQVKGRKSTPSSTAKDCQCGSSSNQPRSRKATGPGVCSTRSADASSGSNGSALMAATNAWQVEAAVAKVPQPGMEIVKRGDDTKGFVVLRVAGRSSAPSPDSHETRVSPRISRTCRNPRHLRDARLDPACPQRLAGASVVNSTVGPDDREGRITGR
jgi:hypothetical protein